MREKPRCKATREPVRRERDERETAVQGHTRASEER